MGFSILFNLLLLITNHRLKHFSKDLQGCKFALNFEFSQAEGLAGLCEKISKQENLSCIKDTRSLPLCQAPIEADIDYSYSGANNHTSEIHKLTERKRLV